MSDENPPWWVIELQRMERKASKALVGKRVKLNVSHDVFSSVRSGTEGLVEAVDDLGTVRVKWDTGAVTDLVWEAGDRWTICNKQPNVTAS